VASTVVIHGEEITGPIQFEGVYVHELHVTRTLVAEGETQEPLFEPSVKHHEVSADRLSFLVLLNGRATYQYRASASATVDCTILGEFRSTDPVTDEQAKEFAQRDALVLLWPYLRAEIGSAAKAMQVPFPPIPIINTADAIRLITERMSVARRPRKARKVDSGR